MDAGKYAREELDDLKNFRWIVCEARVTMPADELEHFGDLTRTLRQEESESEFGRRAS
jgi:hypothetical protein